jgi:transposase-like protein
MPRKYSPETKTEAHRLYEEGVPVAEIARRLGVGYQSVNVWVNPVARAKREEYERQRREDPELRAHIAEVYRQYSSREEVKERERVRMREYRKTEKNIEYRRAYMKEYSARPEVAERLREFHREYDREWQRKRRDSDPAHRTLGNLRRRVNYAIKSCGTGSDSTEKLLGISVQELIESWDARYGSDWRSDRGLHIDHIRPCSSFDLTDPAQQRLCFNYRNLQLLPAEENLRKRDSWTQEMEQGWKERMRELGWEGDLFLVFTH